MRSPWYALGLLTTVYVVNFVDRQILAILLEAIRQDLGLADWQLGFLSGTAFGIFYATLGIPIARLADRWSRKGVIVSSLLIWSIATALCGTAGGFASLLAYRIAVGVGEAGCSPPAHSMITDYFPIERRGTALGIFTMGVPIGILVGFLAGGWLEESLGWRNTFYVVGAPGVLLSVIVIATLIEPRRRALAASEGEDGAEPDLDPDPDPDPASSPMPDIRQVIGELMGRNTFRMLAFGSGLYSFVGYSVVNWVPSMMIRSHGMGTGEVGTWLSLILGIGGCIGTFAGGVLADRWAFSDPRGRMFLPMIAMFMSYPFTWLVYTAASGENAMLWLIIPSILGLMFQAPAYGLAQSLATPNTRALASSLVLFVTNITGLAMGPAATGILSDLLEPSQGADSLRWALIIVSTMLVPAGLCFRSAAYSLEADLESAERAARIESGGGLATRVGEV